MIVMLGSVPRVSEARHGAECRATPNVSPNPDAANWQNTGCTVEVDIDIQAIWTVVIEDAGRAAPSLFLEGAAGGEWPHEQRLEQGSGGPWRR